MSYKQSEKLLERIKKANKILINAHETPDVDSVASALSMRKVLKDLGKDVIVICPNKVSDELDFFEDFREIEHIDFNSYDFSLHDLFIIQDTSDWDRVAGRRNYKHPSITSFVIDNHSSNTGFGDGRILDFETSSVSEMLVNIFEDWGIKIDKKIATYLYAGMLADTGSFQYMVKKNTFTVANKLVSYGADKDEIIFHVIRSNSFNMVKAWGDVINKMTLDINSKFVWSALRYDEISKYGPLPKLTSISSTLFIRVIKGTNFGIVMMEDDQGRLNVSFRSRTDFDVSKMAVELDGGGHKTASGATVEGLPFEKAVEKVLEVARKYAKQG